jgi:biopolymer transport protein ExbD
MGGGGGGSENGEPEFQIAPMIDVLLVLLIFFMSITTSQVAKIDKEIQLPIAKDAKKKEGKNLANEAIVNVRWNNAKQESLIMFQDKAFPQTEPLVDILKNNKDKNSAFRVIIRGDKNLPAIEVQKVMAVIAQSGIDDISFSALNQ